MNTFFRGLLIAVALGGATWLLLALLLAVVL